MARVLLLRDFAEDQRISMEHYADALERYMPATAAPDLALTAYRPRFAPWLARLPTALNMRMRAARYLVYPRQAARLDADLYHIIDQGYAHLLRQLDPRRCVVTVHDVIPLLAGRGLIAGAPQSRRSWLAEHSFGWLQHAARLFAVSASTARDLVTQCGCDPARITVVPNGLHEVFSGGPLAQQAGSRKALGLPGPGTRLVLISGNSFYKNHPTCLQVMEQLQARHGSTLQLVRLGRSSPEWEAALVRSPCRNQVINIDSLAMAQLPQLYDAVDCLLFPSWYEGFGWPPLEAMACGVPVVASNRASLPEVVGAAGLLRAPDDVAGLAEAVHSVLSDDALRARLTAAGLRQAARFGWRAHAAAVLQCYRSVLGNTQEVAA